MKVQLNKGSNKNLSLSATDMIGAKFIPGAAAILVLLAAPTAALAQQDRIEVPLGYSELVRPAGRPEAVIVGNPEIADATIVSDAGVVITARALGSTNLIMIDESGAETFRAVLQVVPLDRRPQSRVRVIEGGSKEDGTLYLCGPQPGCTPIEPDDPSATAPAGGEEQVSATRRQEAVTDSEPPPASPEMPPGAP